MNPYGMHQQAGTQRPSYIAPPRPAARPAPKPAPIAPRTGYIYNPYAAHTYERNKPEPYVAPEPIVQALRQKSLNPEGIRRNANTFKGTANAPVAPEGKTNPSGANRSAQVTSQV